MLMKNSIDVSTFYRDFPLGLVLVVTKTDDSLKVDAGHWIWLKFLFILFYFSKHITPSKIMFFGIWSKEGTNWRQTGNGNKLTATVSCHEKFNTFLGSVNSKKLPQMWQTRIIANYELLTTPDRHSPLLVIWWRGKWENIYVLFLKSLQFSDGIVHMLPRGGVCRVKILPKNIQIFTLICINRSQRKSKSICVEFGKTHRKMDVLKSFW